MLFCLISLVGTASAEDISDNEIISYDDTIDISTENSNLQEISDLSSASDSNDISNEISNADDSADDTSDDVITGSSSKEVLGANKLYASHDLSGSTLAEIQAYLDSGSVVAGDTIYLGNQTWNSGDWGPYSGGPVQVNIPNLIISGGTSGSPNDFATISAGSRIFQLNAPGITLKNIAFTNTPVDGPCCAVNIQQADCTITNCVFDSCRSQNGGAIYGGDSASNTKINNCIFNNCTSMWSSAGAAIYHEGSDLTISNCNFTNNQVDGYGDGGAIALQGSNAKVTDCNFLNNKGSNGGAIYVHVAGSTITNCNFENNSAVSGGAINIYHDDTNINGCNFTNNSANRQGGVIYIGWDCNRQIITNCVFTDNDAGSEGGAIYADSEGNKVTYSNFTGNSAPNGGAIQLGGDSDNFDLEHVIFENNHAYVYQGEWGPVGGHGGAINADNHNEINPSIVDVTFINNTADIAGGAVKHHSNWTFNDCEFINNSANPDNNPSYVSDEISFGGGALWCCDGISNLINTDFIGNNATFGGAIRGAVNAKDCLVENNTAFNGNGGGIDMTIEESLFNNESFLTAVNVKDCTFINNSAQGDYQPSEEAKGGKAQGGAIHVYRVDGMILDNITCIDNSAYRGGAIDLYVMNFTTLSNSTLLNNTATLGGGIAVVGNHTRFDNVTMTDNEAIKSGRQDGQGGGIWVIGEDCRIYNSTIDHNIAEGQGGGAWINGSDVQLNNTVLDSNVAVEKNNSLSQGGGLFVEGDGCIFNNNTITRNNCSSDSGTGGGICVTGENCIFTNNTIDYNFATYGGGVAVDGANTNFTHNNMSYNRAETGGGFFVQGEDLYVEDLYAFNNTAENGGAAATLLADGTIFKNSTFENNTAIGDLSEDRGEGGAIHISASSNVLVQADFINNTACNGSAIYVDNFWGLPSDVKVINSTFFENQAWSYLLNITPENNTYLNEGQEFNISVSHQGGDNIINAIYNDEDCETILNNVTYPFMTWDGQLINKTTPTQDIRPVMGAENSDYGNLLYQDDFENNQIINVLVKDKNGNVVVDKNGTTLSFEGLKTDIFGDIFIVKDGEIIRCIPVAGLEPGRYYVEATHPEDRYYLEIYNFTVLRVGPTDLEINKTVSNATCNVSDIVDWNVTTGNIGPIDAENVTVRDILPEGLDLLNLTFSFVDSINGNWCTGKLDLSSNTLTYGVYNATAGTWTYNEASYDGTGTWNIVIPDIDGNVDILKPVTISLTLNKGSDTTVTLFVSDLLEQSSVVMNLVTNVTKEGEFTNFANVTTDTPETNYTNNNASNTTTTVVELTNLTVIKVWDDENNQDGVRPVNVTIELFADGVKINETVLNEGNNWKYTFTDLPVKNNGQVINYTVNETVINNYTTVISNETAYNWTVLNIHVPELTEVNVTKVWDDENNQDGVRPPSVTVILYADGTEINRTVLSEENNWKCTFPELDKYSNGALIVYTVNETAVANYTVNITQVGNDFILNNTHIPVVTELNVTKVWNDSDNRDGLRPNNVTVYLFANGVKINETNLTEANGWKFTFPDLDVYENGELINYTIREVSVDNYTVVITNGTAYNWTVTNTHISIPNMTVQKIANDEIVYVGNVTSFTIVVTNEGLCNLSGVYVVDTDYSAGLEYIRYENGSRDWTYDGTKWTLVGDLNTDNPTADFTVYFNVLSNGTLVNNVTAKSNLTNETNGTNKTRAYLPNMTVEKITYEDIVYVGDMAIFTIMVKNTGDCNLSNVTVTESWFSDGLEYNDVWVPNGDRDWIYDAATRTWTLVGVLNTTNPFASFIVYFNVTKNGTLYNNVTAKSNLTNETNATNKTRSYLPNMTVQKIANDEVTYVGNVTSFTIVVTNTGDCNLSNVVVNDTDYSQGLSYADRYENGSGNWTYDGTKWTLVGDLCVGQSADFTLYFNVLSNGTLVNNVTAKSNLTNETNGTNKTKAYNPNMTVIKVTLDKEVYVGNTTRFTIVVENTGDCELDKVYVVDTDYDHSALHYLKYENGSRNWNYDEQYSKWILAGPLAVGEKANFTVWFEVLTNGTFVNNVTAGSNLTNETNGTNNTTAKPICDLVITKIVNTTHCYVDDLVEWNITVANRGPSTALDVIVKDVLPEGLQLIDVRGGNYDNDTHEWTIGTLDKNQSVSIVLVTKVLINGTIQNNASVNTTVEESNYTNNNDSDTTKADYLCDLVIKKAVNCTNCTVGDIVEWNITVVNVGPHSASNVIVKDILPKGMELINYRVSVGNFNKVISEWSIGTLEKDTAVSLVLVTKVLIDGTFVNIATVNTTTPESNYTNNRANNTTVASPICDLVISKLVNATKVYKGDIVKWTIKVTNKGPSTAFNVKVKDVLPKGLKLMDLKASKGKYQNGVWTIGKLTKGSSATLTLITKTTKVGKIMNIASVNTTTPESNYTNNKANNTTEVMPICDLVLYKSSDKHVYNVNDTMHWIIKVVNKGPDGAVDAYVKDVLPNSTEFVSYTSSKGSYNKTNGVWRIGDVAAGEEVTLTITCKILSAGSITNKAVVYNKVKDKNSSNNWDNATIKVAEPIPNPPEPNKVNLSLKTGNPLVVLLIAFITIFGGIGLRCRKE